MIKISLKALKATSNKLLAISLDNIAYKKVYTMEQYAARDFYAIRCLARMIYVLKKYWKNFA